MPKNGGLFIGFKGTVSVTLSDSPRKEENARFITIYYRVFKFEFLGTQFSARKIRISPTWKDNGSKGTVVNWKL